VKVVDNVLVSRDAVCGCVIYSSLGLVWFALRCRSCWLARRERKKMKFVVLMISVELY